MTKKINDLFHLKECFLDLKTWTTTKHNNIVAMYHLKTSQKEDKTRFNAQIYSRKAKAIRPAE